MAGCLADVRDCVLYICGVVGVCIVRYDTAPSLDDAVANSSVRMIQTSSQAQPASIDAPSSKSIDRATHSRRGAPPIDRSHD